MLCEMILSFTIINKNNDLLSANVWQVISCINKMKTMKYSVNIGQCS